MPRHVPQTLLFRLATARQDETKRSYEHRLERVSLTHKRDLQALLQVHILGLELVKLR